MTFLGILESLLIIVYLIWNCSKEAVMMVKKVQAILDSEVLSMDHLHDLKVKACFALNCICGIPLSINTDILITSLTNINMIHTG